MILARTKLTRTLTVQGVRTPASDPQWDACRLGIRDNEVGGRLLVVAPRFSRSPRLQDVYTRLIWHCKALFRLFPPNCQERRHVYSPPNLFRYIGIGLFEKYRNYGIHCRKKLSRKWYPLKRDNIKLKAISHTPLPVDPTHIHTITKWQN